MAQSAVHNEDLPDRCDQLQPRRSLAMNSSPTRVSAHSRGASEKPRERPRCRIARTIPGMRATIAFTFMLALVVLCPSAASADGGFWPDREICRAAVKTYFFLAAKPGDATDDEGFLGFRSASGNVYTCRLSGSRVIFRWVNASGEPMGSSSTTFHLMGDVLTVQTDITEKQYRAE